MEIHIRAFAGDVALDTGKRTLEGRFVPYNQVARVVDELPDGRLDIYHEGFRPRSFATQAETRERGVLTRIGMVHAHEGGLGFLGPVVALSETGDGLYGQVSLLRSHVEDVEDLIAEGIDGLSIEFRDRPRGTEVDRDGVRWRTDVRLIRVALEAKGSYAGARVLALRALPEGVTVEDLERLEEEQATTEHRAEVMAGLDEYLAAENARQAELRAKFLPT